MDFNKQNPADKAISSLGKFKVMGKGRVKNWYTYAAFGIGLGAIIAVAYVANQQGQFSQPKAAVLKNGIGVVGQTDQSLPSKTSGLTAGYTVRNNQNVATPTSAPTIFNFASKSLTLTVDSAGTFFVKDPATSETREIASINSKEIRFLPTPNTDGSMGWKVSVSLRSSKVVSAKGRTTLAPGEKYVLDLTPGGAVSLKSSRDSKPSMYGTVIIFIQWTDKNGNTSSWTTPS